MPWAITLPTGPASPPSDTSWVAQAACRDKPIEWFFPEDVHAGCYNQGKSVCATCPVSTACLAYVRQCDPDAEWVGLWAGLSPTQRKALARHHHTVVRRTRAPSRSGDRREHKVDQTRAATTGSTSRARRPQGRSGDQRGHRVDQAREATTESTTRATRPPSRSGDRRDHGVDQVANAGIESIRRAA